MLGTQRIYNQQVHTSVQLTPGFPSVDCCCRLERGAEATSGALRRGMQGRKTAREPPAEHGAAVDLFGGLVNHPYSLDK
jgi:hypothetical protein